MTTGIYGLADPRDGLIHYVGKAMSIRSRYKEHIRNMPDTPRGEWLAELRDAHVLPVSIILEVCDVDGLDLAERWWIAHGKRLGWPLTNIKLSGSYGYKGKSLTLSPLPNGAGPLFPRRPPTPEDAALLRALRQQFGVNETLRRAYGGKNQRYAEWLKTALGEGR